MRNPEAIAVGTDIAIYAARALLRDGDRAGAGLLVAVARSLDETGDSDAESEPHVPD